jgi:hypothetical protein
MRKIVLQQPVDVSAGSFPAGAIVSFEDVVADDLVQRGIAAELTVCGTGVIASGMASTSQPHGLGHVPAAVQVTPQHTEVAQPWVTGATAIAFTVNIASSTTGDRNFYWSVS